jgi:hypothetical protein
MNWDNVPQELIERSQWVVWRYVRRDGRDTKVPFDPRTGKPASATDPSTWRTVAEAKVGLHQHGGFDGIGFVFSGADPFAGVDLDHCLDEQGQIQPWAQHIVDRLSTYTEISPSGRGLKLFLQAEVPAGGNRKGRVEMYDSARYFTVTGQHLAGTPRTVEARQAELTALHAELFAAPRAPIPESAPPSEARSVEDAELLARARQARNGEKFVGLFERGDLSGYGGDESAADLALCCLLAFWCKRDVEWIDRLFRQSALMRPKWGQKRGEMTYGGRTIRAALARSGHLEAVEGLKTESGSPTTAETAREPRRVQELLDELKAVEDPPDLDRIKNLLREMALAVGGHDQLEVAIARESAVQALAGKVVGPARLVDAALNRPRSGEAEVGQGASLDLSGPVPWEEPVVGTEVLDELEEVFSRFVALPEGAAWALALWTLHAHAHEASDISPLLILTSPEMRCGKTTTLSILRAVVPKSLPASHITPAALFRAVEMYRPTLLIDEADSFLGDREDLRGILNSGHMRSAAFVLRTVGDNHEVRGFSTWAPKVIALIGRLPSTLTDRAIVIPMRRKLPGDRVARLRLDRLAELADLPRRAARWTADHLDALRRSDPEIPAGLHDRAADNWRPLLAIANVAGAGWPEKARQAASLLSKGDAVDDSSVRVQLLADLRDAFQSAGTDRLFTESLLEDLHGRHDRSWGEYRGGKPLSAIGLSRLIKDFGVKARKIRIGDQVHQGYLLDALQDPFARYLPPDPEHPEQTNGDNDLATDLTRNMDADVPAREEPEKPMKIEIVPGVPDEKEVLSAARGVPDDCDEWGEV